ncbi:MAG: 2-amino-4-hydroxy-6-hydroxymethyldihydropteridine diphosphokinase [Chloroflexota bacterium]|nr:2-amino-4-hydroxy-6-hydroxymethyldihydropteridine diphosphokinase [Chloroflexota bacterium]
MACVYLGLGANLGDRQANIEKTLALLNENNVKVCKVSPFYETEPWGLTEQPPFLNAACCAETRYAPHVLLDLLKCLEKRMGRVETGRYGPRPIDIDILMYDDMCFDTPKLTVPHPGMTSRATVLVPLADIAPQKRHPRTGLTIAEHLEQLRPVSGIAPYPPGLHVKEGNTATYTDRSEQ